MSKAKQEVSKLSCFIRWCGSGGMLHLAKPERMRGASPLGQIHIGGLRDTVQLPVRGAPDRDAIRQWATLH